MCLKVEKYNEGAQYESPETKLLGRVVLGFPKPLECTDSFPYQLLTFLVFNGRSPMWCYVLTDPLRDGLNLSSSLVLDAACGQLGPLSFCFLLHCLIFSVFFPFFSFPHLRSLLPLSVYGFKANRSHDCLIPLLPPSDYVLLFAWNSLFWRHHKRLIGSGHLFSCELCQLSLVGSVL